MKATEVMNPLRDLDAFTRAYIECALWASMDDDDEPLDRQYSWTDITHESLQRMMDDCKAFQEQNAALIGCEDERAGHDFWLTRNHHGAGFWDGDWIKDIGESLTNAAHAFGECGLYVGDDDKIYAA